MFSESISLFNIIKHTIYGCAVCLEFSFVPLMNFSLIWSRDTVVVYDLNKIPRFFLNIDIYIFIRSLSDLMDSLESPHVLL